MTTTFVEYLLSTCKSVKFLYECCPSCWWLIEIKIKLQAKSGVNSIFLGWF